MPHSPGKPALIPWRSVRRRAALAAATALLVGAAAPPAANPQGVGDRLFPDLGNPGYDVAAYDIKFNYHGNSKPLDAVTTIAARATTGLDHFNLDFSGGTVRSVTVNGLPAQFASAREDLVVTPSVALPAEGLFTVVVRHSSEPRDPKDGGWIRTKDGLVMANQADAGHRVFPCNDHPSDKARFTFHVTAPSDLTVVANGRPEGRTARGANTAWTYRSEHPMATELAQVSIGRSAVVRRTGPHGLSVRDVVPAADRQRVEKWASKTPEQIAWMEKKVGAYPFENYGLLIADASTGFELETQTLSLFERGLFIRDDIPAWYLESIMVHELAHQWFGDSVSPASWSDLWLNEGHATWYEALYAEQKGGRTLDARMRTAYEQSAAWRTDGGPPAQPKPPEPGRRISIFRPGVYDGGALVLYALRQKIGTAAFDRLQREWINVHRDESATTADFTALASQVSGQDLREFLQDWLYGTKTPPMPGHPDWKTAAKAAAKATPKAGPKTAPKPA
ncbi:M1 family metallopeptidase [Streptomyces klenkii]|uniref:M1 family metallopeptidase n=1 Tax=Streptomyces klenkii TaxID=1420899 RepID=UPI0036F111BF